MIDDINRISDKLLTFLRDELKDPGIDYASSLKKLEGGYETAIYRFRLAGVGEALSQFLVIRLYPSSYGAQNAIWESTLQNVLAESGYPAAKPHFLCTDMSVLGGAFFIMDSLPGSLLITAHPDTVPELMGRTHAALHRIDPKPLIEQLQDHGVDPYGYSLEGRFAWLKDSARKLPWVRESVDWLVGNRPPEPAQLSVCHGDFHPLNILVENGQVTGVLDWGGFAITDPVYDVANAVVLSTIPAKHLLGSMAVYADVDWELFASSYLSAYLHHNPLDLTCLDYYRVRRCVMSLIQGVEGQAVWQHPGVIADVVECIRTITGIQVVVPAVGK